MQPQKTELELLRMDEEYFLESIAERKAEIEEYEKDLIEVREKIKIEESNG